MRAFKPLAAAGLPEGFDAEIHTEEPIVEVSESEGKVTLSFTFPGFYLSDDDRVVNDETVPFEQVNIAKTGFVGESGKPLLPSFGRYVQIPFNTDYQVSVETGDPVQFEDVLVTPAQQLLTDGPEADHQFEYDREAYESDALYPKDIVEVSGPHVIDGYNALLVHVRPLQYSPAKRTLYGYGSIKVNIALTPRDQGEEAHPLPGAELNREGFGNLFLNPNRGVEARVAAPPLPVPGVFMLTGPEFLIIYDNALERAAKDLAEWKNKRGLVTEIVPVSQVGNSPAQIKTYVRGRRKMLRSRLRYVLLLGDTDTIAAESVGGVATDYYYSTPTDPVGQNFVLPWLSVGRMPVTSLAEAREAMSEIIGYEKTPPADAEYYRKMLFAGFFQTSGNKDTRGYVKAMEDVRQHLITLGFDVDRVYVTDNPNVEFYNDGTSVPADVKAAILDPAVATQTLIAGTVEGHLVMGHRDHGNWDGWYMPPFTVTHLDQCVGSVPTLFYSINCLTGQFDRPAGVPECFAEKMLSIKGTAPSLVAATRVSGTFRNNSLIKALFDAIWPGVISTFPGGTASYPVRRRRLGDMLNYAKSYLPVKHSGDNAGIKNHFEIYHVIGDPTLEAWSAAPQTVGMKVQRLGANLQVSLAACPQDGIITIWVGDTLLKAISPLSPSILLKLPPGLILAPVTVCFWAPGYRYREVTVKMHPPIPRPIPVPIPAGRAAGPGR